MPKSCLCLCQDLLVMVWRGGITTETPGQGPLLLGWGLSPASGPSSALTGPVSLQAWVEPRGPSGPDTVTQE